VRRRESLLAAHPLTTPSSAPAPPAELPQLPSASAEQPEPSTAPPVASNSQQIASAVLAGTTAESPSPSTSGLGSPGQPLSPDMVKLLAALSAGQGGSEHPVHVIIRERESYKSSYLFDDVDPSPGSVAGKGAWIPSFARFLVFAGIATFCRSLFTSARRSIPTTIYSHPHRAFRRGRELWARQGCSPSI